MTQTTKEILEYLQKRYQINTSTTNYLINKIDGAIEEAYSDGLRDGSDKEVWRSDEGCDCGQPSCKICN